MIIDFVLYDY